MKEKLALYQPVAQRRKADHACQRAFKDTKWIYLRGFEIKIFEKSQEGLTDLYRHANPDAKIFVVDDGLSSDQLIVRIKLMLEQGQFKPAYRRVVVHSETTTSAGE